MKVLRVHGHLLDRFIEKNKCKILLELKNKYDEWALAKDVATIKQKYVEYNEFFDEHLSDIRNAIGSERKLATFIGHRVEEFVYLLCLNICSSKESLEVNKFSRNEIISWIGINSDGKLSVSGENLPLKMTFHPELRIRIFLSPMLLLNVSITFLLICSEILLQNPKCLKGFFRIHFSSLFVRL